VAVSAGKVTLAGMVPNTWSRNEAEGTEDNELKVAS